MPTPAFGKRGSKVPNFGRRGSKAPGVKKGPISVLDKTEARLDRSQSKLDRTQRGPLTDPKAARLEALKKARNRYKEA